MKYTGIPLGMWLLFEKSFREQLVSVLGYDKATAKSASKTAKRKYKEIINTLPQFERDDRFQVNIVSCAMLASFVLSMPVRPDVNKLADYYAKAMMTKPMEWFCRQSEKKKFSECDRLEMRESAAKRYADVSGYEARFTKCGICTLMRELGLYDLTPALCRLDHTMSDAGGAADFVRKYTLASGRPYCDCGYKRKSAK